MQFNSEANGNDIVTDVHFWADTDTTSYSNAAIARNSNRGLDRATALIMEADNVWDWDDSNNTDLPIATTTLVSGQSDYGIAVTHLKIKRVRVKDAGGTWRTLRPRDRHALNDSDLNRSSGMPEEYDMLGNSIVLSPAPASGSVTLTAGLEIQFQRGPSYFVPDDTTKTPGFASQFHRLIPLYAALDYLLANEMSKRAAVVQDRIRELEQRLQIFYSSRDMDTKISLSLQGEDYGQFELGNDGRFSSHPDKF